MKLSEEIKEKIKAEHKQWMDTQYAGKSLKERQKLGAFFTPPELAIEMIENYDSSLCYISYILFNRSNNNNVHYRR